MHPSIAFIKRSHLIKKLGIILVVSLLGWTTAHALFASLRQRWSVALSLYEADGKITLSESKLDAAGNIYSCGYLFSSAYLGSEKLTSVGRSDIIVTAHSANGALKWRRQFGGPPPKPTIPMAQLPGSVCRHVAIDASGNIIIAGNTAGTFVFGTAADRGRTTILSTDQNYGSEFVAKLSPSGEVLRVLELPHNNPMEITGMDTGVESDGQSYIYLVGSFNGTLTIGANRYQSNLWRRTDAPNGFIAKLNSNLQVMRSNHFTSTGAQNTFTSVVALPNANAVGGMNNNLLVLGSIEQGSVDFVVKNLSTKNAIGYVVALDKITLAATSASKIFVMDTVGGGTTVARSLAVNKSQCSATSCLAAVGGRFMKGITFQRIALNGNTSYVFDRTTFYYATGFVSVFNANTFAFHWAKAILNATGTGDVFVSTLAVDSLGGVFAGGTFSRSVFLDGTIITTMNPSEGFISYYELATGKMKLVPPTYLPYTNGVHSLLPSGVLSPYANGHTAELRTVGDRLISLYDY